MVNSYAVTQGCKQDILCFYVARTTRPRIVRRERVRPADVASVPPDFWDSLAGYRRQCTNLSCVTVYWWIVSVVWLVILAPL